MVDEKYFLEIIHFNSDQEPEEELVYSFDVSEFEIYNNHIVFKNCLNNKILEEIQKLNLLKRSQKMSGFHLILNLRLRDAQRDIFDHVWFPYQFNYTETDFIIHDAITSEDTESFEASLHEKMAFFLKQKQFLKYYLEKSGDKKQWFYLNEFEKECWLNVAYKVNFNQHVNEHTGKVSHIILDGNFIQSTEDLYCSIGEEVCGVFGYMGYNSAALRDCLEDDGLRPIQRPLNITWKNFSQTQKSFDCIDDLNYFVELLKKYAHLKIEF